MGCQRQPGAAKRLGQPQLVADLPKGPHSTLEVRQRVLPALRKVHVTEAHRGPGRPTTIVQAGKERLATIELGDGCVEAALGLADHAQVDARPGLPCALTDLPEGCQAIVEAAKSLLEAALLAEHVSLIEKDVGLPVVVGKLSEDRPRLVEPFQGGLELSLVAVHDAEVD